MLASKPEIDAALGRLSTSALECTYLDCRKLQRLWAALQRDDAPLSVYLRAHVLLRGLIVGLFLVDTELCTCVRPFLARLCELGFIAVRQVEDERAHLRRRYLGLLKRALVNLIYPEHELRIRHLQHRLQTGEQCVEEGWMRDIRYRASEAYAALMAAKTDGSRPAIYAHTLIDLQRLYNIEYCAEQVFADGVLGDFLEAGVCQGGAAIFMRALQVACGEAARRTWVADSFQGLPPPVAEAGSSIQHGLDARSGPLAGHQPRRRRR